MRSRLRLRRPAAVTGEEAAVGADVAKSGTASTRWEPASGPREIAPVCVADCVSWAAGSTDSLPLVEGGSWASPEGGGR